MSKVKEDIQHLCSMTIQNVLQLLLLNWFFIPSIQRHKNIWGIFWEQKFLSLAGEDRGLETQQSSKDTPSHYVSYSLTKWKWSSWATEGDF